MKLGIIDIITKLSSLLSHLAMPREGHLEQAVHIMAYVGQNYNSRLGYDSSFSDVDHIVFKNLLGQSFLRCQGGNTYKFSKTMGQK